MTEQANESRPKTMAGTERLTDVLSVTEALDTGFHSSCLVVLCGAQLGKRIPIDDRLSIGREPENDLSLELGSVSRYHAEIVTAGDEILVYDLNSTNGTLVNSKRIDGCKVLLSGDQVTIGRCILKVIAGDDVEALYHEEVHRLAITDGLTGAHNRRALMETLQQEVHRATRYDRELTILMLDVDHFKQLNDRFGHIAGDQVLQATTSIIHKQLRQNDFFARFGGEEFVILLPEADLEGAKQNAERLREQIATVPVIFQDDQISYTVSIGVASLDRGESATAFLERADSLMYKAKAAGRNIVRSA